MAAFIASGVPIIRNIRCEIGIIFGEVSGMDNATCQSVIFFRGPNNGDGAKNISHCSFGSWK